MSTQIRFLTRALTVLVTLTLLAVGGSASLDAAGLLVAEGRFGGELEIKEHSVKVVVNNGVAVTELEQIFVNKENRMVEALYTFPVPSGASVANFSMWINGKEMIGEVVEKKRARKIYESYKATQVDPGLLEQVDYKRFEMRIYPIAANAEQRIKVTYYQELDFDHDEATYVYPLATTVSSGTARTGAIDERTSGKFALSLDVKSEVPIVSLSSPSHTDQFITVEHSPNYCQASLEVSGGDLSRDVVLHFDTERPRTGFDIITAKQGGEDGYFQLTLTAGQELEEINHGMDYVFILDVSGSMANDGKMRMSRNSLQAFIESLGPQDRFEMMAFNISPNPLWSSLQTVSKETQQQATDFLAQQKARGGTSLWPAVSAAYRYDDPDRILNIVVLSDGMTGQSEQQELLRAIDQRPAGSRVFCIGVGNDVNRPILNQLAQKAGGIADFISQEDDFERAATAFRRKLLRPAATNVNFTFGGVEVYDLEPKELPNLFYGAPLRLYGRYKNGGTGSVTFKGEVLGQAVDQSVEVNFPKETAGNSEIERMWAYRRVEQLMRAGRLETQMDTNEIIRLCEEYSIISQYASFIVLENDAEYQRWKIKRRNANRIVRDRSGREIVNKELAQLRERALDKVQPLNAPAEHAAGKTPVVVKTISKNSQPVIGRPPTSGNRPSGFDIVTPGSRSGKRSSGGGGAIDPFSGAIALGLAGAALARRLRRRKFTVKKSSDDGIET